MKPLHVSAAIGALALGGIGVTLERFPCLLNR